MAFTLTANHGTKTSAYGTGTVLATGDLLAVGLWNFNATSTLTAISDTVGTSWTTVTIGGNGCGFALSWGFAGGTGANSLTTTWNTGTTTFEAYAEFNGSSVSGATADGTGAGVTGSGTSVVQSGYTTSGSDDLVLNFAAPASGGTSAFAFGGSWVNAAVSTSFGGIGYQADVAAGTYTPSASWTGSSPWGSIILALKAASGGGGGVNPIIIRPVMQAVNRASTY